MSDENGVVTEFSSDGFEKDGILVQVDKVVVTVTSKKKLAAKLPEGMTGAELHAWLKQNSEQIGYTPIERPEPEEELAKKKIVRRNNDMEPLMPYDGV